MENEQKISDLLRILQTSAEDIIGVQKPIFDICNDWNEANVLAELWYWTSPSKTKDTKLKIEKDGYRWLACTRIEWWERRRLTTREVDRAIVRLMKKGLVVKHIYKFNGFPTIHLRLNLSVFIERFIKSCTDNFSDELVSDNNQLEDAMKLMNWESFEPSILPNVSKPFYQNGKNINSNILNSNIQTLNGEKQKNELHLTTDEELEKFKEYSKSYGKPKPEKKPKVSLSQKDYADSDAVVQSVVFSSSRAKGSAALPERYLQQVSWFTQYSGLEYFASQKSKWISAFEDWDKLGVVEEDVMKAVDKLRKLNYSITSPQSLTNVMNGIVAERKAKPEQSETHYNPWR